MPKQPSFCLITLLAQSMAARLSFSWQPASNAAIEKRVLYRVSRGCPGLTTLIRVTRFCQAMPLRQKAVGLLFKVFLLCIIQTSLMVESNCQILWKQVPSSRSGIYMNLKYISYRAHHLILHSLIGRCF